MRPDPTAPDYYRRVGSRPEATAGEVRRAVRARQKAEHPDRSDHADATERFQRVMEAADCLTDSTEREAYDAFRERFAARAATAYETWVSYGRPPTPRSFTPPGVRPPTGEGRSARDRSTASSGRASSTSDRERATASTGRETSNSSTDGATASETTADASATGADASAGRSAGASNGRAGGSSARSRARAGATASGAAGGTTSGGGDRTTTGGGGGTTGGTSTGRTRPGWFDHRQSYERPSYAPPAGIVGPWLRTEAHLLWRELLAGAGLAAVAAVGVVAVAAAVLVAGVLTLVLGTALAIPEFLLRSAGVARFDAFAVASVGLTWVLELALYLLAAGVAWLSLVFLGEHEDDGHLGNRLRLPELLYLLPVGVAVLALGRAGDGLAAVTAGSLAAALLPGVAPSLTGMAGVAGATWMACHRSVRVARESPPVGRRESLRGSVAGLVWIGGVAALLLAGVRLGVDRLAAGYPAPYEDTVLWAGLTPDRLLAGAVLVTGAWMVSTTAIRLGGWLRERAR